MGILIKPFLSGCSLLCNSEYVLLMTGKYSGSFGKTIAHLHKDVYFGKCATCFQSDIYSLSCILSSLCDIAYQNDCIHPFWSKVNELALQCRKENLNEVPFGRKLSTLIQNIFKENIV